MSSSKFSAPSTATTGWYVTQLQYLWSYLTLNRSPSLPLKITSSAADSHNLPMSDTVPAPTRSSQDPVLVATESSATEQQAHHHWSCLRLIVSIFALTCADRGVVRKLLMWSLAIIGLTLPLLQVFITHHLGTTIVAGSMLWIVYGGYRRLKAPAWLQHPDGSTSSQHGCLKVCNGHCATQVQPPQHPVNVAPLVKLACSSIMVIHDVPPRHHVIDTTGAVNSPVLTTADPASPIDTADGSPAVVVELSNNNKHDPVRKKSRSSSNETSRTEGTNMLVTSESAGSTRTPMSSVEDDNERDIVTTTRPRYVDYVTPDELEYLMKVHENPTFHEGPLNDLWEMAICKDREQVDSRYSACSDDFETFTAMASSFRPVSEDAKDIEYMLPHVRHLFPAPLQAIFDSNDIFALSKIRDGRNGSNLFVPELELLWHREHAHVIDGVASKPPNLTAVRDVEKVQNSSPSTNGFV